MTVTQGLAALRRKLADYLELVKPGIVSLILLTTAAAMAVAASHAGVSLRANGLLLWGVLAGVGLASGGGGALNCYIDRDIDRLMRRTARRAIPSGRVPERHALVLGLVLSLAGIGLVALSSNALAAGLTAAGLAIYVGVYSLWLKRRTPQNIVIGGAAGALGPAIGWAAVTGQISWLAVVMFLVVFLWTPPHFWTLALLAQEDYRRAGVPMLPVVAGEEPTRRQVVIYTGLLVLVSMVPVAAGMGGAVYAAVAAASGLLYLAVAVRAWRRPSRQADRWLFHYSITYLGVVYGALALAGRVGG
ncbi:MAG TPA: heme o synthase [Limnochordales bacterium]